MSKGFLPLSGTSGESVTKQKTNDEVNPQIGTHSFSTKLEGNPRDPVLNVVGEDL